MVETERQKTERLLREQLARIRQAEDAAGTPGPAVGKWKFLTSLAALRRVRNDSVSARHPHSRSLALRWLRIGARNGREPHADTDAHGEGALSRGDGATGRDWGPPPKVRFPRQDKNKDRRSDFIFASLGVMLGLTCGLFPWYIFFNQEQFGVQAIAFGGRGKNAGRIVVEPKSDEELVEFASRQLPRNLDLISTGTARPNSGASQEAPGLDQQPFPDEAADFRLVHVANGRAMIEDDAGLWIVQQGSRLPDSTRVKAIEMRNGQWVLVTSGERVIEISR